MPVDAMRVRLHLRLVRVIEVETDTPNELVVRVGSTRSWSRCPHCGFICRDVHDRRRKKIRDLPVSGRPMTLVWDQRRLVCGNCGRRHLESHPEFEGGLTRRLARDLVRDAKVMSIRAVARRHRLGWARVMTLVTTWSVLVGAHRRSRRCRVLLVDETSMRRRHRYVTVLLNGETGEVLAMVAHRNAAALSGFLVAQGPAWRRRVRVVVTDGSKSYRSAIGAHLPHATHVLDRFHVVRWFATGLTLARREAQRREPRGQVTPAFVPEIFRARFVMLTRADHLTDPQRERLDTVLDAHPQLRLAWQALQELYGIYTAADHDEALAAIRRFAKLYRTDEIPSFDGVLDTLVEWLPEILAFHHARAGRVSNGRLEGTNNKLQVLRRVAYGFTNRANYEARGILACPPLPSAPPRPAPALTP